MNITASMVKELREKTGAGMMDCKKALQEAAGDVEKAVDLLRQKGISKAAKKAGRATSEGLVGFVAAADGKSAALIEVKCETDFVARGEKFQNFVRDLTAQVMSDAPADEAALLAAPSVANPGRTVQDMLTEAIATIGENIQIGRFVKLETSGPGMIGSYLHFNGKTAALVEMRAASDAAAATDAFRDLSKDLAMQVAASAPLAVSPAGLDPALVDRERDVYRGKARAEGKPENIVEKIAEGAVKKYYKEVCLLDQPYIRDEKVSVADVIKNVAKTTGSPINVVRFVRIQLGVA